MIIFQMEKFQLLNVTLYYKGFFIRDMRLSYTNKLLKDFADVTSSRFILLRTI